MTFAIQKTLRKLVRTTEGSSWGRYVLGALYFLKSRHGCGNAGGADLFIASDLPPNKGVSSSAALEVATLKAASAAWGVRLNGVALATAGQWVENVVAAAACGIMDQAAIVLGVEDHLLPILCQPCQPFAHVRLPAGLQLWGIDSMVVRSTTGVAYETARAAAFIGYKLICQYEGIVVTPEEGSGIPRWTDSRWRGYLSNLAPSEFRSSAYESWLPESLSGREFLERAGEHVDPFTKVDPEREYPVRAAVRYATEENLRGQIMYKLLEAGMWGGSASSLRLIGEILCQSHIAYSECDLGSEACDELVSRALKAGFPGAKMTGGGAGGVVAILGRSGDQGAIHSIVQGVCAAEHGAVPHIFEGSSGGVEMPSVFVPCSFVGSQGNAIVQVLRRMPGLASAALAANGRKSTVGWARSRGQASGQWSRASPAALHFFRSISSSLSWAWGASDPCRGDIAQKFRAAWRLRREFFLAGICGQLMAQVGMTLGVNWSTASNGAILSLLIPIFGALIAVWLLRERLSMLRVGALLLGRAGVFLLSPLARCRPVPHQGTVAHELVGNLLIATGCLGSAFYNVYSKRLLARFSRGWRFCCSVTLRQRSSVCLVLFYPLSLIVLAGLAGLTPTQWAALLNISRSFFKASRWCFFSGRYERSTRCIASCVVLYLMPLFGVALAYKASLPSVLRRERFLGRPSSSSRP